MRQKKIICLVASMMMLNTLWHTSVFAEENLKTSVVTQAVSAPQLKPITHIDTPVFNSTHTKDIRISGWTLNQSGIKSVSISVDGIFYGNALTGLSRPDVNIAFPGYLDGDKSGYNYLLDIGKISAGQHTITVTAEGFDGSKSAMDTIVQVKKLQSITFIDSPKVGTIVESKDLNISGWALNQSGIKEVKIYVDSKYITSAATGLSRPDVNAAFPGYKDGDKSGYKGILNLDNISNGNHDITVEVLGNDGSIDRNTTSITVKKLQPLANIEAPLNNSIINNQDFTLSGWSISPKGVKQVKIYADSEYLGDAAIGGLRADVNKVFPAYPNSDKSGFWYNISVDKLKPGIRTLTVESIGNDGTTHSISTKVDLRKAAPITTIDAPVNNVIIDNKNFKLSGWAVNASDVKEVKVYLNNVLQGKATIGGLRRDVNAVFPQYKNSINSGYEYDFNIDTLPPGEHTIKVESIGVDGTTDSKTTKIQIKKPAPLMVVDTPKGSSYLRENQVEISGWALNASAVKEIKIYADGKYRGNAKIGLLRLDVNSAFPGYKNGDKSGFTYTLDISSIPAGSRTITVESIGYDGTTQKQDVKVEIVRLPSILMIDSPREELTYRDSISISGWALGGAGIQSVKVLVDDTYIGDALYGGARPDVGAIYADYKDAAKSGYSFNLDTSKYSIGAHKVDIEVLENDGQVTTKSVNIYIYGKLTSTVYTQNFSTYTDSQVAKVPVTDSSGTWKAATREQIEYYLNPSNFMYGDGIFQFLRIDTYRPVKSVQAVNDVLKGKGVLEGAGELFVKYAQSYKIDPVYFLANTMLETGNGKSTLAKTTITEIADLNKPIYKTIIVDGKEEQHLVGYEMIPLSAPTTVHNLYGIGAYDNLKYFTNRAYITGTTYAYNKGWTSVDAAIAGAAEFVSTNYIHSSQKLNTLYKMRWNPTLHWRQYSTDIGWAYKQSKLIKGMLNLISEAELYFDVPKYQ